MSLFALLPMLLSVSAGRLVDRVGPRLPLAAGLGALACAAALPFLLPHLATLYVSSTLVGTAFMVVHIAMNSVFGAHGSPEQRAVSFSWLALAFSFSGSLAPLIAGYAIVELGHAAAFAVLGLFPLLGLGLLALRRRPLPRPERSPRGRRTGIVDLLRVPALRRTLVVSALLAMGWDLYAFVMPLYGARLGLAATSIGLSMSTFGAATLVVRLAMPVLVKRIDPWAVIAAGLGVAGAAYLLFPLVASAPPLMALSFILGLGLGCAQPVIMSVLYEASPPGRQGEAVGVRTLMLNASHTFIPLASGAISAALGMAPMFVVLAAGLLAGGWLASRHVRRA
jgi:predicted MFS family arabinose efflux permease